MRIPSVKLVKFSENRKTGPVANTYVSQATCPESCPLRGEGCYAESGPTGLLLRGVNASEDSAIESARLEAEMIDGIDASETLGLRVHVAGDCRDARSAGLVGAAMVRYEARSGRLAWTYTHSWREIPVKAWKGARVVASCETAGDVAAARARGYATALVIPRGGSVPEGVKARHCSFEARGIQCLKCQSCMRPDDLRKAGETVVFQAHGSRFKVVGRLLAALGAK